MTEDEKQILIINSRTAPVRRTFRDTVFRILFASEDTKHHALSLYNALTDSNDTSLDDLRIFTLDEAVYIKKKNDAGILIADSVLHLWEHMSTINPNMPLRVLIYFSESIQKYLAETDQDIYGRKPVHIPAPQCYEFYNGLELREEKKDIKLSSLMPEGCHSDIDLTLHMYNIDPAMNKELFNKCPALYEYSCFIQKTVEICDTIMTEANTDRSHALNIALDYVLNNMPSHYSIREYLMKERAEVFMSILYEYDEERHNRTLREEGIAEGKEEERLRSINRIYSFLLSDPTSAKDAVSKTAEMLGIPEKEIRTYLDQLA